MSDIREQLRRDRWSSPHSKTFKRPESDTVVLSINGLQVEAPTKVTVSDAPVHFTLLKHKYDDFV